MHKPQRIPLVQSLNAKDICMIFCGLDGLQQLLILPTMLRVLGEQDWVVLRSRFHTTLSSTDATPAQLQTTNTTLDILERATKEILRHLEASTIESSSGDVSDEN